MGSVLSLPEISIRLKLSITYQHLQGVSQGDPKSFNIGTYDAFMGVNPGTTREKSMMLS